MTGRSRQILERFPAHFEPARPGKVLGEVVDALAHDLDVLAARLAAVRRSHRLGEADEIADLLLIGGLHGIRAGELEIAFMRFARARELATGDAEALIALWSIAAPSPRLPLFAPPVAEGGTPDPNAARTRLLSNVSDALRYGRLADALRMRIGRICELHARGNGTVRTVVEGAANALDLDMGPMVSSADRYWHAAAVRDRLRLARPVPKLDKDGKPTSQEVPAALAVEPEIIGIEENPQHRVTTDSLGRKDGEIWSITRRGFERALIQIRITGLEGGRTIGPMVVNCDEGRGVGYAGSVPQGKTLVFTEEGRALLDGADVTSSAYAWEGACFADTSQTSKYDFAFDGPGRDPQHRAAVFVTATPLEAMDRQAVVPHGDVNLPAEGIAVGVTRYAFFVQQAHFNSLEGTAEAPVVRLVTPRNRAAFFDGSLFAAAGGETLGVAAEVAFSWLERRAFSARLLIPARFRNLADDPEGTEVRRRVSIAIERFRPVGVEVTVEFIDDRWSLGGGTLTEGQDADLIDQLRSAMVLWAAPAGPEPT